MANGAPVRTGLKASALAMEVPILIAGGAGGRQPRVRTAKRGKSDFGQEAGWRNGQVDKGNASVSSIPSAGVEQI